MQQVTYSRIRGRPSSHCILTVEHSQFKLIFSYSFTAFAPFCYSLLCSTNPDLRAGWFSFSLSWKSVRDLPPSLIYHISLFYSPASFPPFLYLQTLWLTTSFIFTNYLREVLMGQVGYTLCLEISLGKFKGSLGKLYFLCITGNLVANLCCCITMTPFSLEYNNIFLIAH